MMNQTITTVGIDVSKGKRAVAVRRADRKIVLPPVQIDHTADGVSRLVEQLREIGGDMRIVMEHTRMY